MGKEGRKRKKRGRKYESELAGEGKATEKGDRKRGEGGTKVVRVSLQ